MRDAPADCAQGNRRIYRRPPDGGALARGAVAGARRHRNGGGNRRRGALWLRAALGFYGNFPDLPAGRRQGRHAALSASIRPGAAVAVDQVDRCAGINRRLHRKTRAPVRRAGGGKKRRRTGAHARRMPDRGDEVPANPERKRRAVSKPARKRKTRTNAPAGGMGRAAAPAPHARSPGVD